MNELAPPRVRGLLPGAALPALVALAAGFISTSHGGPQLLYALLLGIGFNYLAEDPRVAPGLEFCSRHLLRLGVGLLGARITASQIVALGWSTTAAVIGGIVTTILAGVFVARRLGMTSAQGVLTGGSVAICGASAALALSAVLPLRKGHENFTVVVVVAVTLLSTVAMLVYPVIARLFELPPQLAGLFIGGSIHDVAQVVGAGYALGAETGDVAIVVKLLRVSLLVFVVAIVALVFRERHDTPGAVARPQEWLVPWFLWMFVGMVALNSTGIIVPAVQDALGSLSRVLLLLAIAALGINTSFAQLVRVGWVPVLLIIGETLWLGALVFGVAISMR